MSSRVMPPRLGEWMMLRFKERQDIDSLVDDLCLEFQSAFQRYGTARARLLYWRHVIRALPFMVMHSFSWRCSMFGSYVKLALRNLLKNKMFSIINIVGLSVAMALGLLILKSIIAMYSSDRFHERGDDIYRIISRVTDKQHEMTLATAPMPLATELEGDPGVEAVARVKKGFEGFALAEDKILPLEGYFVDPSFFRLFDFRFEFGGPDALNDPYSMVMTRTAAERLFGEKDPLGETITFPELGEFRVTGILEDVSKRKSNFQFDCLTSTATLESLEKSQKTRPSLYNWKGLTDNYLYVLLRPGASIDQIRDRFQEIVAKYYDAGQERKISFQTQSLFAISPGENLANNLSHPVEPIYAYWFGAVGFIVLFIASINYTSLSLARALARAKEIGIRKIVGANRLKLFVQFIGESVVFSMISLFIAYGLLSIIEPLISPLIPDYQQYFGISNGSLRLLFSFFLFAVATGIMAGLLPSLYLSRFRPVEVLKDITRVRVFSRLTLRKLFLVFQFFVSFVCIVITLVFFKQMRFVANLDFGFESENIINVDLQGLDYGRFREEMSAFHAVVDVSASAYSPGTGTLFITSITLPGKTESDDLAWLPSDAHLIDNLKIPLVAGRKFTEIGIVSNHRTVLINETAVPFLGFADPVEAIGKVIAGSDQNPLEIIGVVKDFIHGNASGKIMPLLIQQDEKSFVLASVRVDPRYLEDCISYMKTAWKKLDPVKPFEYQIYSDQIKQANSDAGFLGRLLGGLTLLSLMVAVFGLIGMVSYETQSRIKEIGIRKVLGATVSQILFVTSRAFFFLLAAAGLIGTPVSWFLSNMILRQNANHPELGVFVFIAGFLAIFGIGFLIILSQTVKAALINPIKMIRYE